ncbi:DUF4089 domain-containing protein [Hansschlegelia sp.]|uniref:DUF4089 domain-containing protein n=1 Tax=Hansschlegelia sp. TaxID=2041892 RepID=UPI002C8713FF|nr:DUF4089 domain-containing protein [Hansschlegelia sp.]HVI29985.1 DUF4089 domain-containing protein [Hansschlegelia sp.]
MLEAPPRLTDQALEAHIDAATTLLGLRMDPDDRASTLAHLRATMEAARFVAAFPLDDTVQPAPIFRP